MTIGVGIDVVHLPDFEAQLADANSIFLKGTFTPGERAQSQARPGGKPARHLAARYAAKEAFIKAWSGSRWGRPPLIATADLSEIEVLSDRWGRPRLKLHGALAAAVGSETAAHVSLSHDGDTATAMVVLERITGA